MSRISTKTMEVRPSADLFLALGGSGGSARGGGGNAPGIPKTSNTSILEYLRPVRVEQWRAEGLFRCRGAVSEGARVRFVMFLRARAFDSAPREMCEAKGAGRGISRDFIKTEKIIGVYRTYFRHVSDEQFRRVVFRMICTENLRPANAIARAANMSWPEFVADFNTAIDEMITKSQKE